jgi:hypothetical protein
LIDEFKLPKDAQRLDAPTPYVWIIGRVKTDGPADYDAVHKIQEALKVTPLSQWGKTPDKTPEPVPFKADPSVDIEDAAEAPGRSYAGEPVLCLCGGFAEAQSAPSHR